jgi:hypothetical protein
MHNAEKTTYMIVMLPYPNLIFGRVNNCSKLFIRSIWVNAHGCCHMITLCRNPVFTFRVSSKKLALSVNKSAKMVISSPDVSRGRLPLPLAT